MAFYVSIRSNPKLRNINSFNKYWEYDFWRLKNAGKLVFGVIARHEAICCCLRKVDEIASFPRNDVEKMYSVKQKPSHH
jgi:hypothetical protein